MLAPGSMPDQATGPWQRERARLAPVVTRRPALAQISGTTTGAGPGRAALGRPAALTISARPERLAEVRAFVTRALGGDYPSTNTVVLLVIELVSNSLRHSRSQRPGGQVTVTLRAAGDGLRAEVHDDGADTVPALQPFLDDLAESGRGLQIVDRLSSRWGYQRAATGTTTWIEIHEAMT